MIYIIIVCLTIIGFLGVKLYQKKTIDTQLINEYLALVQKIKEQLDSDQKALNLYNSKLVDVRIKVNTEQQKLTDLYNLLDSVETSLKDSRDEYHHLINDKIKEIDETIEELRQKRQAELDRTFEESKAKLDILISNAQQESETLIALYKAELDIAALNTQVAIANYVNLLCEAREKYESILAPLQMYEKEQQEKLYYTILLPEEFHEDIDYLLTVVSTKVRHPDIISKLVWTTYVKPYLDELCKRADIKDEPGIYKITNMNNGKSYIGKSTNVKKRIQDHMKSTVGISSIADQAVHHEILKTGFWNWTFEIIIYCEKEQLSELEKYYIDFFKSNSYGYNKTGGGEG